METRPYLLHAISPLHAGTGQAVDVIDLPIARMRSTGIPFVPGSSVKGVLREERREKGEGKKEDPVHEAVFGPLRPPRERDPKKIEPAGAGDETIEYAGALVVSDARLLALPVRSFRGTFALVTSPVLLHLAGRDLKSVIDLPKAMVLPGGPGAYVASLREGENVTVYEGKTVFLEDLDLEAKLNDAAGEWAKLLLSALPAEEQEMFRKRFVVVDDETMTFLWETATQLDTRIRIDPKTGTVAKGALWTEESLPAETLLIGVLAAERSYKKDAPMSAGDVLSYALPGERYLQFGGKATVGRGRCRIAPFKPRGGA